ncbi:MAG: MopE-related protein [Polyangia bacterium]
MSELACVGAVMPTQELCNGKDDDCDGLVDEDFPTLGQPCNQASCQGAGQYVCNAQGTDVQCTVSSVGPTPEICDGIDNDCDGIIDDPDENMPGVGVTCGSNVGECQQGVSACVGGHIVCNDVGPTPEVCNGKDDDCDGIVDDGVVPPASSCNPPGLASGAPIQGECKPGHFQCEGVAGWVCVGGIGPTPEICDGKDNDCDGQIDNGADCGIGAICLDGQCVPLCADNEQPCAPDRYCQNGACLLRACVENPCPTGQLCNAQGSCYDPCAGVTCLAGATCQGGLCQDCYSRGCPARQICHNRECEPDPCQAVQCDSDQSCNNGTCVRSCATVKCPAGQSCRVGVCVTDPCAGLTCATGSYCDPSKGTCLNDPCLGISCVAGTVCVQTSGTCESNPCEVVRCPDQQACAVQSDGHAECVLVYNPNVVVAQVKPGSRGLFGCTVSGAGSGSGTEAGAWVLVLLGLVLARRRRRQPGRLTCYESSRG